MLAKLKSNFKSSKVGKWLATAAVTASIACMGVVGAFAAEESGSADLTSAVTESFNTMKGDIMNYILIALPIALGVVAAIFGIKYAVKFFTNMSKKG